jgi:serine/threonine protein kinase/Tfp pilus assembly protein PilF
MHDDGQLVPTLRLAGQANGRHHADAGVGYDRAADAACVGPTAPYRLDAPHGQALPLVGGAFLGFRLLAVLGKGAFGQVYLAEQADLANRYVALKVARDIFGESQTLAQLQHTNIVPIYSLHRVGSLQAVCMPYLGATTLADVLARNPVQGTPGRVFADAIDDRRRATATPQAATHGLEHLERMSYVEAVLWIGERLADGLAHAHERGIVHRDLKPANVLLTDDGQPMLLDFSISEDTKRQDGAAAILGGTLPYMAPEQLASLCDGTQKPDARSDLYALGVVLYELLAGTLPFRPHAQCTPDAVAAMVAERRLSPCVRTVNRALSPAVAAIVGRCLTADPARRYQTARELQEDLRRQRQHLPLRYTPEPSLRERSAKWVRRHPRLTSTTSVAPMLGVLLGVLTLALWLRGRQLAHLETQETLRQFRDDAATVQFLLYNRHADRGQLDEGMRRCKDALDRFAILDDVRWYDAPAVQHLSAADRAALREEAGEVLLLFARATAHADYPREAQRLNALAEASFGAERAPRALYEQRADLARLLGNTAQAEAFAARAQTVPLRTARDLYLVAHQQAIHGNLRQALTLLEQVTQDDPRGFPAWFVRGNCHYDLAQDAAAITCFSVCITLRPEFHGSWFNRGLARLRLRQFRQGADDFDHVLRLRPGLADAYVSRALAHEGMQEYAAAIADHTQALTNFGASTRVYFLRAAARAKAGDPAGARRDYDQGLAAAPADEMGWIARGSARRDPDPKGAIADYEEALRLNPRSFDALQNKAALLSDKFHDDAAALAVLEQTVAHYPESALARGGRGVLLARAGRRAAAVADAQACLLLDSGPATQYQAGCIYALTSKQNADDRLLALPLLAAALRAGFGLEFVERDSDLEPLRHLPEFRRMVAAVRALHR